MSKILSLFPMNNPIFITKFLVRYNLSSESYEILLKATCFLCFSLCICTRWHNVCSLVSLSSEGVLGQRRNILFSTSSGVNVQRTQHPLSKKALQPEKRRARLFFLRSDMMRKNFKQLKLYICKSLL